MSWKKNFETVKNVWINIKQEARGPHLSLQFINTFAQSYDYTITLLEKNYLLSENITQWSSICKNLMVKNRGPML